MLKKIAVVLMGVMICAFSSAYAIAGIGVHYGWDVSVNMADKTGEAAVFDSLKLQVNSITGVPPTGYSPPALLTGKDLPIYIDRKGFASTPLDLGGKFYVDAIPFLDAIEISANFGLWQYTGKLIYPASIAWNGTTGTSFNKNMVSVVNDTLWMTLDSLGKSYMGLSQTPYAKLNTNLTIRKNILTFPPLLNILKLYAGGGFSINFATPILSAGLIKDALGTTLNTTQNVSGLNANLFGQTDIQSKIMDQIITRLITPHYGCHIVVGAAVKFPVFPLGFYLDGKFMIPFGKLDPNVDIGGAGLLINAGVTLGI